ncbi:MAG TPA: transposase, partial [Thermoanaerobaculia bacterium]
PGLERYRPRFRYLALDVKRYPLSELERMPNRAAALFQLEQSRGPEEILRGLERLREILSDRSDRLYGVYSQWLTEIFFASQAPPDVVERVRTLEDFSMLVDNILEWKKNVLLEGRKEGREEGLKEGEEVGIRKGELAVLIRQLTSKFGPLPAEVVDRLERADVDLLLAWSDRVLTARTLDEVLAD